MTRSTTIRGRSGPRTSQPTATIQPVGRRYRAHQRRDADGRTAVRMLRPQESDVLDTLFAGLSLRSRYLRFHAPLHRLSPAYRRALLDVDGRDRIALVAELATARAGAVTGRHGGPRRLRGGAVTGRRPVGIARLIRTGPTQAEISIAVVDDAHRLGIGRRLLTEIDRRAVALGLTELHAHVLTENTAALSLFRSTFAQGRRVHEGNVVRLTCLPGQRPHF